MARPRKVQKSSTPAPRQRRQPVASPDDMAKRFADFPAIDLLQQQMLNPGDAGSLPILLADEDRNACVNSDHQAKIRPGAAICHLCGQPTRRWMVRWVNTQTEGRWAQMKARAYVAVLVSELQDSLDISDLVEDKINRYVRRGDSGKEILMKRPLEAHHAIKQTERERRAARVVNARTLREDLAEGNAEEFGDEAGQMVSDGGIQVESVKRDRTTIAAETAAD